MKIKAIATAVLASAVSALSMAHAQISVFENDTQAAMETALEGPGIDVRNLVVERGTTQQYGTFSNGSATIGINAGVFISSGRGLNFADPATNQSDIANLGNTPDPDLTANRPNASNDTASLVMTVTPIGDTIRARIVFASEEYPDYVCSEFNDAFGLYVSGPGITTQNIAVIPGTMQDVSINTINNGLNNDGLDCPGEGPNNTNLYNDNPSGPNFIYDGYTDTLVVQLDGVTPGQDYTFKMVVADAVDQFFDSAVFVDFLESQWANTADVSLDLASSTLSPVVGQNFAVTATLSNAGPDPIPFLKVADLLPDGLTFVSASGDGTYNETLDEWETTAPLAAGASYTLTLTVTAPAPATYATNSEAIEQWSDDVDSTPNDGTGDDFDSLSVTAVEIDRSDVPVVGTSFGEATHVLTSGIRLGAAIDADTLSIANADASGDGADDDGVTFPMLTQGASATIPVSVAQASGNSGYLQGWIDWNGDGDFADAGEQVATNLQSATAGTSTINVSVTVPGTAVTTQTFARFRWSTTSGLDATTAASDGEVEDYAVTIAAGTPAPTWGAINYPNSGNGLYPGSIALLDWSTSGLTDGIREGDSVSFALPTCRSGTLTATFSNITNPENAASYVPADMQTWSGSSFYILYNGPGTGEALQGGTATSFRITWSMTLNGTPVAPDIFLIDAEATALADESISATTNGGVWSLIENAVGSGYVVNGIGTQSVLIDSTYLPSDSPLLLSMGTTQFDIAITPSSGGAQAIAFGVLLPCDSGDAAGLTNASHAFAQRPASGSGLEFTPGQPYLGTGSPDAEVSGQPNSDATGDDADVLGDDEDGVTFPALAQGASATISVDVTQASGNSGYLQGWIDWNGDGDFADAGEQVATNLQSATAGTSEISVPVTVPGTAVTTQTFARFRWSTTSGLDATTAASDGEVEDYAVTAQAGSLLPTEVAPQTCALPPSTAFWQRAAEWNSNNGGDVTQPNLVDTNVFSNAQPFSAGPGITINALSSAVMVTGADEANFNAAYLAGDYLEYTVQTIASLGDTHALSGFSENGGRDSTPSYQMDLLVSTDDFSTANRLFTGYTVDGGIDPGSGSTFSWITNIAQAYLLSNTEYKFRLVFYGASPTGGAIMMDDFSISVDQCGDRGDAPSSVAGAREGEHYLSVNRDHYIGSLAPDAEFFVNADDNTAGETTTDEESGVVLPTFTQGQTATVQVPVTGSGGLLNAWIDWDQSETFDAGERIATDATIPGGGASGTIMLSVAVPADAVLGTTYARFRWSPNSITNPTDNVAYGEVEDYAVTVAAAPLRVMGICEGQPLRFVSSVSENPANGLLGWADGQSSRTYTNVKGLGIDLLIEAVLDSDGVTAATNMIFHEPSGGIYRNGGSWRLKVTAYETGTTVPAELTDFSLVFEDFESGEVLNQLNAAPAYGSLAPINLQSDGLIDVYGGAPSFINAGEGLTGHYGFSSGVDASKWAAVGIGPGNYHQIEARLATTIGNPVVGLCGSTSAEYGDAPSSYGVMLHEAFASNPLRLGSAIDAEYLATALAYPADASGDGADDDGVTFPALAQGASATISVDVTQASGNSGYLQGWIDWNGDGDFADAGEQVATNLQSATAGTSTINVNVTVPGTAVTTQTFARFRWSTTSGLGSTGAAADGEVEDYALTIALGQPAFSCSADFGQVYGNSGTIGVMDLNSQTFNNLGSVGVLLNAAGFRPSDGYVYAMGGETLYRIGSDGSATSLGAIAGLPAGQSANQGDFGPDGHLHIRYGDNGTIYRVNVETATLDGSYTISPYFNDTADFAYVADRNLFIGVRGFGATPRIFAFRPNTGASQSLGFIDPGFSGVAFGAAFSDSSGAFFAVNNSDGTLYEFDPDTGEAIALGRGASASQNDGFLCRDATVVRPVDRSDGPLTYGEATHAIQLGILMGALLDGNETPVANADATGDDLDVNDDEDGVTIPTLIPGQSATIDVDVRQASAGQGYLNAWIDWNGDGDFSDSGEQVASDVQFTASASGTISLSVTPPRVNASGQTFARFRWSSRAGLASFGPAPDGEVEDYAVTIAGVPGLSLTPDQTGQLRACGVQDYTHVLLNTGGTGEIVTVSVASQSLLVSEIFLPTEVNGAGEASGFVSLNALTVGSQVATLTNGSWALEALVDNGAGAPAFDLAPGEQTRVRARVTAPCETASGQVDTLVLRAVSSDGDASAEAVDVTTVSSNTLEITKLGALDAGCAGGADGPFDDARVRAEPGDCVIWQLTLLNTGTESVCDVEARDAAPAFTTIQGSPFIVQQPAPGAGSCAVNGGEFTCNLGNPQDIDNDGSNEDYCLSAGETAIVEFSVRIE